MMKKTISLILLFLLITNCAKSSFSTFGRGVSIGFDPRTVGMQIDDTIMRVLCSSNTVGEGSGNSWNRPRRGPARRPGGLNPRVLEFVFHLFINSFFHFLELLPTHFSFLFI